jgi:hypothetical protein
MKNTKEIILLGSGPIGLIKAYFLLKDKSITKLTFIDSANEPGGAWYSEYSPKNHKIECGCHIWSYCKEVHDFIDNEIGIKLYPMNPNPVFNIGKVNLSYSIKNTIDSYKFLLINLSRFNFKKIKEAKNIPSINFKVFNKKNVYPKLGSPELIDTLLSIIKKDNRVIFNLNEKLTSISVNENVIARGKEKSFSCDKLYTTSTSHIEHISHYDKKIEVSNTNQRIDYIHFLIKLNKKPRKTISYLRLMSDKIIHRVSDISYQTKNEEYLMLFGIKESGHKNNSTPEILAHIQNYLISQKIITKSHSISLIKEHIYPTYYTGQKIRDEINSIDNSKIELIHSTDIIYSIYYLMKQYKAI